MDAADPGGSTRRKRRAVAWGAAATIVVIAAGFAYLYKPQPALSPPVASPTAEPVGFTDDLMFTDFTSSEVAWALHYPTRAPQITEGQFWISRTVDGGRHWQVRFKGKRTSGAFSPATIRFFDKDHGLAFLGDSPPQFLSTTNGGANWQSVLVPSSVEDPQRTQIAFGDASHGWVLDRAVDGQPLLYETRDGGYLWKRLADPPAGAQALFPRRTAEVWIGWHGTGPLRVYLSIDSGHSWQLREIPYPASVSNASTGAWATFVQLLPGTGVVVTAYCDCTRDGGAYVWTSFDGGATWRIVPPYPGSSQFFGRVAFQDGLHWWLVFDQKLQRSSDAGQTWTQVSDQLPGWRIFPTSVDAQHAWALITESGAPDLRVHGLATTSDAGLHWTRVTVPISS